MNKILIVDDNTDILELLKDVLQTESREIVTVNTVTKALEILKNDKKFTTIILDINLPDGTGFDIAEVIQKDKELYEVPIVFITGLPTDEKIDKCFFNYGAWEFIPKPFNIRYVQRKIEVIEKINEKKLQADEKVIRQFQFKIDICDNLTDMVWAKDIENKFIFVNKAICEKILNENNPANVIGKDDMYFAEKIRQIGFRHDFGEMCLKSDEETKKNRKTVSLIEEGYAIGNYVVLDVKKSPLYDKNDNFIGTVGSARDITKEIKLQKIYEFLYNHAIVAMFKTDIETGKLLAINETGIELLGYKNKEEAIKDFQAINHYYDPKVREEVINELRQNEIIKGKRIKIKKVDNQDIWIEVYVRLDKKENTMEFIAIDISSEVALENKVKKNEIEYKRLLNTLNEGIWVIDKDGYTSFTNSQLEKMFGYEENEMIGKHLFEFINEKEKIVAQENLKRRKQGITETYDFKFLKKDGTELITLMEVSPIFNDNGEYDGAIAGVADITEKRQLEKIAKQESEKAQIYFNLSPVMMVVINREQEITMINKRSLEILGYENENELIGRNWFDTIFRNGNKERIRHKFISLMMNEENLVNEIDIDNYFKQGRSCEIVRKDNGIRIIEWYNNLIYEDNKIVGIVSSGLDITSQKRIEEKFNQLKELINQFGIESEKFRQISILKPLCNS